jgi:hypothetical protein
LTVGDSARTPNRISQSSGSHHITRLLQWAEGCACDADHHITVVVTITSLMMLAITSLWWCAQGLREVLEGLELLVWYQVKLLDKEVEVLVARVDVCLGANLRHLAEVVVVSVDCGCVRRWLNG